MAEKKLLKIKDSVESPVLEIGIGVYHRRFEKSAGAFEVDSVEADALLATGYFETTAGRKGRKPAAEA